MRPAGSLDGPAIELQRVSDENGSGQYQIAEAIARVFPAYRSYAKKLWELIDLPFPSGPEAADRLTYQSKTVVEYRTAAGDEGMGTRFSRLSKSGGAVSGVAILIDDGHEMVLLSMRLPAELGRLDRVIVREVEQRAVR
jgi:hypothetical protein